MNEVGSVTSTALTDNLTNGPLSAPAVVLVGDTSKMWGAFVLPLDLAIIGSPGCFVNINPIVGISAGALQGNGLVTEWSY